MRIPAKNRSSFFSSTRSSNSAVTSITTFHSHFIVCCCWFWFMHLPLDTFCRGVNASCTHRRSQTHTHRPLQFTSPTKSTESKCIDVLHFIVYYWVGCKPWLSTLFCCASLLLRAFEWCRPDTWIANALLLFTQAQNDSFFFLFISGLMSFVVDCRLVALWWRDYSMHYFHCLRWL